MSPYDETRRRFLIGALAAGTFAASPLAYSGFWGSRPKPVAENRSFYKLNGAVAVNGVAATEATLVKPGDVVESGVNSTALFVVGQDAFMLRENSRIDIADSGGPIVKAFSLLNGALLTVFGRTGHTVQTTNVTIGIRGTGVYLEAEPDQTYVCTCYGTVDIASRQYDQRTTVVSKHHDEPKYVLKNAPDGRAIIDAPFKNHTDMELAVLEALVGRSVPFDTSGEYYGVPKRTDY